MSATTLARPARRPGASAKSRRHTIWITLGALASAGLIISLAVHGFSYYILPQAARVASPLHARLKPSGTVGHALGTLGGTLFLLMYLYPLRKHWSWLSRKGSTKNWLDFHILMGLSVPFIISFHAAFKFQGIAGLAYWLMMSVVASGVVGRYLYGHIPRRIDQAEMSMEEVKQIHAELARQLEAQNVFSPDELQPLLALPGVEEVQRMPLARALLLIVRLDVRRAFMLRRLRRRAGAHVADNAELREALALAKKQAALSRDIVFLSKMHKLFHLWHVIHRPFSYSFAALAALHVLVVVFLGYF